MTKVQRRELADMLLYLDLDKKPTKSAAETLANRDLVIWGECLANQLAVVLRCATAPYSRSPKVLKLLDQSWQALGPFIESTGISVQQTYYRRAFYELLARLLVAHCRQLSNFVEAPLGLQFCLGRTAQLPGLFERAFPGYLESGMCLLTIKAENAQ